VSRITAAIFDIGGVLTESPVTRIKNYAARVGISDDLRWSIFGLPGCPWDRFERSELTPAEFADEWDRMVHPTGCTVAGLEFLEWFFQGFEPRPEMIEVVRSLRGRVKLGSITNNVAREQDPITRRAGLQMDLDSLFDVIVESSLVGMRKPEPGIYRLTCELLGVEPPEAVFLDDMGTNLKGAKALGMTTIRVDETHRAIDELEAVLEIPLPRPAANGRPAGAPPRLEEHGPARD
jgi:putative hydrolase of the HAD superfamily